LLFRVAWKNERTDGPGHLNTDAGRQRQTWRRPTVDIQADEEL
jgi:hypothetical protein